MVKGQGTVRRFTVDLGVGNIQNTGDPQQAAFHLTDTNHKLTIQNAFGDVRVRAGSAVVVALNLGDIVTNNYMVVNKVTHTFRGDEHMMELDLIGGEFIA